MTTTRRIALWAPLAALAAGPALAAEPAALTGPAGASNLRVRTFTETSLSSREGREYRILVSAPEGPPPSGGFPVFYVLDGHAWFGPALEIARMRENSKLDPAIIVGVGYPSRRFFDPARSYDFTPPGVADERFEPESLGGADKFLTFLTETLKPHIAGLHPVHGGREALFGHSLGGLFTLYTLFTRRRHFPIYLAASPSMGFGDRYILAAAERFSVPQPAPPPRLLVTMGQFESQSVEDRPLAQMEDFRRWYEAHPEARPGQTAEEAVADTFPADPAFDRVEGARAMVARLARSGVHAVFAEFEGEEHSSAAISALNRGVPFALRAAG